MNKLSTENRFGAEMKTFTRKPISLVVDYVNILKGKRTSYWHSPKGLELCFSPDGVLWIYEIFIEVGENINLSDEKGRWSVCHVCRGYGAKT